MKFAAGMVILALLAVLPGCSGAASGGAPSASSASSASAASALPPASADGTGAAEGGASSRVEPLSPEEARAARVRELLAGMTLREKVGQLFLIRPESLCGDLTPEQVNDAHRYGVTGWSAQMEEQLRAYPAGGVVLFGKNLSSPQQLTAFLSAMQRASALPLLTGIDEEGGAVSRLANAPGFDLPRYESMAAVGATGDEAAAKEVGAVIGGYLRQSGFTLDFAPVADVNTNPENLVIGERAFGGDPQLVARMVGAEIEGLHEAGMLSCVKHFPGHGDTRGDTHDGYVSLDKTWDELKACELIPFVDNLSAADLVMVAHITLPNVTGDGLPASLSEELVTGRLRGELGYTGLIVTDSLAMGAIAAEYSAAESAVLALKAGVDLLLMPEDYAAAYEGVLDAVESGTLTEARIDESVGRILALKLKCGLL